MKQQCNIYLVNEMQKILEERRPPWEINAALRIATLRNLSCVWAHESWTKLSEMASFISHGWEKIGFNQVFEHEFQREAIDLHVDGNLFSHNMSSDDANGDFFIIDLDIADAGEVSLQQLCDYLRVSPLSGLPVEADANVIARIRD